MKNLETLGVQEMDVCEMKEENGGIFALVAIVGCLLLTSCVVRREAMPGPGGGGSW